MAGGIFISYRREDTSGFAGRLFDHLCRTFPRERVFLDVQSIEPGANFAKVLTERVGGCDVLLALIGRGWLEAGQSERLTDPADFVRVEIEAALSRGVRIIPVLIDGARMPSSDQLPPPIRDLASRQAVELSHNRFDRDVEGLADSLAQMLGPMASELEGGPRPGEVGGDFGDVRAVAVLPFENLSKDPDETYFVDGLTDDIITALAYWRWFPVVARNSTFAFKGRHRNVTEVGRELSAAYVVDGSVRRMGQKVRISVQLIDAISGMHLFGERYEREMADIFALQDEIAEKIVANIEPEIHRAEARRAERKHPADLGAWELALKALALQERMSPTGHAEARVLLRQALAIDPGLARASALLALCHYHEGILGWAPERGAALAASLSAAANALEHDDREWLAHGLWGMGRMWTMRDFVAALEGTERAVALNPSAPLARHFLACILEFSGRPAEAIPHLEALLRLDPRYKFASLAIADQSMCHFLMGDLERAIATAEKAVRTHGGNVRARQRLVAALSLAGRIEAAKAAADDLTKLQPGLDIAYLDETYPFMIPEERDRFVGALQAVNLLRN